MFVILPGNPEYVRGVRVVEERAHKRTGEAELVDRLRARGTVTRSLLAVEHEEGWGMC